MRKRRNPAASPLLAEKRNLAECAQKDSLVRDTRIITEYTDGGLGRLGAVVILFCL